MILPDLTCSRTDTKDPTLTGSGDPSAVVTLSIDGQSPVTTTADALGAWNYTPSGLAGGNHTVMVAETDIAGNTGTASLSFLLDTTPPTPAITNEVLSNGKVTLTGTTAEANDSVSVYDGSNLLGTVTTNSSDNWKFVTGTVCPCLYRNRDRSRG